MGLESHKERGEVEFVEGLVQNKGLLGFRPITHHLV